MHKAVAAVMEKTGMLKKSAEICEAARKKGCTIIHVPIELKNDDGNSDNPNPRLGILKGCAEGELFTAETWGAQFAKDMEPRLDEGDLIVRGKRGLDSFPNSNLEELLVRNGIETVAIGGFLTSCCVESTMRLK